MMTKRFLILFLSVWSFVACQNSLEAPYNDIQRFTLSMAHYEDSLPKEHSRAVENGFTQLKVGIYDNNGILVKDCTIVQSEDLTQLTVEDLKDGDYTAVFIGIGEQRSTENPTLRLPKNITDRWLADPVQGMPHNNEYFYAKSHFKIQDGKGENSTIAIKRIVGRVDLEPILGGDHQAGSNMESLLLTFDDGAIYTNQTSEGSYGGKGTITNFETVDGLNFYTLPTVGSSAKHGSLTIIWRLNDNSTYKVFYEFDLIVKPNKRSIIRPTLITGDDEFGTVRVYDKDRNAKNSSTFFQDPTDAFHRYKEIASHTFKMNELLQLNFTETKMTARFYSLIGVKDVKVYAKRPTDNEFFEVAWFESVAALEERTVTLSSNLENRLYRTESGGIVFIDQLGSNLSYKYASEDPHMKKLAALKWPCRVAFRQPVGNDTLNTNAQILPFRAVHAREAIALWTNVAFMYSHPKWEELMLEKEKEAPFMENGVITSVKNNFFPKIFNENAANYITLYVYNVAGALAGFANIGNGDLLGLRQQIYSEIHYTDSTDPRKGYIFAPIEYGHTLGYGDNGDFAMGKSTEVNTIFFETYRNELPYPTLLLLNSKRNKNLYTGLKAWS